MQTCSAFMRMMAGSRTIGWYAGLLALALVFSAPALAQQHRPIQLAMSASGEQGQPNMFEQIGRWWDRSMRDFNAGMQEGLTGFKQIGDNTRDAVKDAANVTGSTVGSLAKLPQVKVIRRRQLCEPAPNGGPDCRRAATTVCKSIGFTTGNSFEVQSEEICPVDVLVSQRTPRPGECRTETYVVQSVCQ